MPTFTPKHDSASGKFVGVSVANDDGTTTAIARGGARWDEFLAWHAAQPQAPFPLADKPPPPPVDQNREDRKLAKEMLTEDTAEGKARRGFLLFLWTTIPALRSQFPNKAALFQAWKDFMDGGAADQPN